MAGVRDLRLYVVQIEMTKRVMRSVDGTGEVECVGFAKRDPETIRVVAPHEYKEGNPILRAIIESKYSTWGPMTIVSIEEFELNHIFSEAQY